MTNRLTRLAVAFALLIGAVGTASLTVSPAEAGRLRLRPQHLAIPDTMDSITLAQGQDEGGGDFVDESGPDGSITIRPRQAASIARDVVPGAKVLNVRLLPSGIYAVTLRGDGKLTRVMVDGRSGDIL